MDRKPFHEFVRQTSSLGRTARPPAEPRSFRTWTARWPPHEEVTRNPCGDWSVQPPLQREGGRRTQRAGPACAGPRRPFEV